MVKDCGASNTIFETSTTYGRNIIFKSIILFVSWDTNFSGLRRQITSCPHKFDPVPMWAASVAMHFVFFDVADQIVVSGLLH